MNNFRLSPSALALNKYDEYVDEDEVKNDEIVEVHVQDGGTMFSRNLQQQSSQSSSVPIELIQLESNVNNEIRDSTNSIESRIGSIEISEAYPNNETYKKLQRLNQSSFKEPTSSCASLKSTPHQRIGSKKIQQNLFRLNPDEKLRKIKILDQQKPSALFPLRPQDSIEAREPSAQGIPPS